MSMVTVQPDEMALFVKTGEVIGYAQPGQHRLDEAQIPIVGKWIEEWTRNNVLISELYFVSTREFPNNKYGGRMGSVKDPILGIPVNLRNFGEYAFKIVDPQKFILNLVGTRGINNNDDIEDVIKNQLMKLSREIINLRMKNNSWDIFDITSGIYNTQFEQDIIKTAGQEQFLGAYGIQVTRLEDFNVNMAEADKAKLQEIYDRKAKMELAKDPSYAGMANAEAVLGAGEGMKQGGEGAGMAGMFFGANMGAGIAGQANGQFAGGATEVPKTLVICPKCNNKVNADSKFCPECGEPFSKTCSKCSADVKNAKFCPECGEPVGKEE